MADDKAARKEAKKKAKAEAKAKRKEDTKNLSVGWQYTIGIIVAFNGFLIGESIGWLSSATKYLKDKGITAFQLAWLASAYPLGAAVAVFLAVGSAKLIGHKNSILLFEIANTLSWLPLLFSDNFIVMVFCRLGMGLNGAFNIFCPIYIAEMAHKCHRGTICVFYQLLTCCGMTFAYMLAIPENFLILNASCFGWHVIAILLTLFFVPESPYYLLKKNKTEKTIKVMQRLRGKNYDINTEIEEIQTTLAKKESAWQGMKQKVNLKAFGVLLVLHSLQQLSGSNVILYFAKYIFDASHTDIDENLSVILLGVAQVLISVIAIIAVDRSGRMVLYIVSFSTMLLSATLVGNFFTVDRIDSEMAAKMGVVPTISLIIYICGNSLGDGPLPWTLLGEYLPNSVKEIMGTLCTFVNYLFCFLLTWLMPVAVENGIGMDYIFYTFASFCLFGIVFVLLFLVETNQKSMEEIQADIATHKIACPKFGKRKEAAEPI